MLGCHMECGSRIQEPSVHVQCTEEDFIRECIFRVTISNRLEVVVLISSTLIAFCWICRSPNYLLFDLNSWLCCSSCWLTNNLPTCALAFWNVCTRHVCPICGLCSTSDCLVPSWSSHVLPCEHNGPWTMDLNG